MGKLRLYTLHSIWIELNLARLFYFSILSVEPWMIVPIIVRNKYFARKHEMKFIKIEAGSLIGRTTVPINFFWTDTEFTCVEDVRALFQRWLTVNPIKRLKFCTAGSLLPWAWEREREIIVL